MSLLKATCGRHWSLGVILAGALVASSSAAAEGDAIWTGDVSAALTSQTGTIDTFSGSLDAKGDRKSEENEFGLRFTAVYGTSREKGKDNKDDTTIQDSQAIFANWKRIIHDRFFWETGSEVSRDSTQDRDVRARIATGPGYRVWRSDDEGTNYFDVVGGLGYRYELYDTDTAPFDPGPPIVIDENRGRKDQANLADVVVALDYKNTFFDGKVEYSHTGSASVPANKPSAYILRSEILIGLPLTEAWSFRTGFLVEYVAEVPDATNSTTTRTTVGLGYKF